MTRSSCRGLVRRAHERRVDRSTNADLIENDRHLVWKLDPTSARSLKARPKPAPRRSSRAKTDAGKNISQRGVELRFEWLAA